MIFDAPSVLALAPVIGGAVWFTAAWARRVRLRRAARWSSDVAAVARAAGRWGTGPTTLSLAAFLGVAALAGPRWGEETVVAETRGLNLVVAIDISRSMLAEDVAPSRLGRARREARRLILDLEGDRLGLIGFAGTSYVLSPLSIDGSALTLFLDALDPDVASEGGSNLAAALRQGADLLTASPELADRVLVVFTDGEAHDSLSRSLEAAKRLHDLGMHLILVAEGGRARARIPVRDDRGALRGWQRDDDGNTIETARSDAILNAVADAAQGTLVASELPDQAGAIRDLVAAYKRSAASETRTQRGRPRAWLPIVAAAVLLLAQGWGRRTAALVGITALILLGRTVGAQARPRTPAEKAWDANRFSMAAAAYATELADAPDEDRAWYNAGTAALAAGQAGEARRALSRAAASTDPGIRFRALYNLGYLALREADADSANRDTHLDQAERVYREALLLRPQDRPAKWNLELAVRRRRGGGGGSSNRPPPSSSGGGGGAEPESGSGQQDNTPSGGLSRAQAEQILQSIGQEELRTRRERTGGQSRSGSRLRVKDW